MKKNDKKTKILTFLLGIMIAEVSELKETRINKIMKKENISLNRDHGLCVFKNLLAPEIERKRKETVKLFQKCGL